MSGSVLLEQGDGVGRRPCETLDVVAADHQVRPDQVDDVLVVLDEQDAGARQTSRPVSRHAVPPSSAGTTLHSAAVGRLRRAAPRRSGTRRPALCSSRCPPWARDDALGDRPARARRRRPSLVPRTCGSKIRSATPGGMPRRGRAPRSRRSPLRGRGARRPRRPVRRARGVMRVLEQVHEHLLEAVVVGPHRLEVRRRTVRSTARRRRARSRRPPRRRGRGRTSPGCSRRLPAVDGGGVEQVADQAPHAGRLAWRSSRGTARSTSASQVTSVWHSVDA